MKDYVEAVAKRVISEGLDLPIEQIVPEATFVDLGADSLDFVEIVMAFEDEFLIMIPDEAAEKFVTVGDAITYLNGVAK